MKPSRLQHMIHSDISKLLLALFTGKCIVLLAVFLAERTPDFLYFMSTRWDAQYFQTIAQDGYTQTNLFAFSPVYPYLLRFTDFLTGHSWISGLILTNILSFLFPLILYKTFGYRTALLAGIFPIYLVYTTVPYSDIVPMTLLALSIMFMLRKQVTASSTLVTLAMISSYRILWILPSYLVALWKEKRWRQILFYFLPAITGGLLLVWFYVNTSDCLIYLQVEENGWGTQIVNPLTQIKWILNTDGQGWFSNQGWKILGVSLPPYYWLLRNIIFAAFYLLGAYYLNKTEIKHKHFLIILSLSAVIPLFCITGMPAISIPRLLLPAFPIFYGYTTAWGKRGDRVYGAVSLVLTWIITLLHTYSFFA